MASQTQKTRLESFWSTSARSRIPSVAIIAAVGLLSPLGCNASGDTDATFDEENPGGGGATHGGGQGAGGQSPGGGSGGDPGTDPDAGEDPNVNDADPGVDTICSDGGVAEVGPLARACSASTLNECDGSADVNSSLPNGANGNGYDDDCDGQVDEGCACPPGVSAGQTKECWLASSSQADTDGAPAGWCNPNSRGTTSCISDGSGEFAQRVWDGECRGAQPPFADDLCAMGDFDCDGADLNSRTRDCTCQNPEIICPTDPLVVAPYPDPANLPVIDGATWIQGGLVASAWKWEVTGGDCDNILPHPSFQLYPTKLATGQAPVGVRQGNLGANSNQVGLVYGPPSAGPQIYPAFALSGDYLARGVFKVAGVFRECTVRIQVRAPGIRAEACWTNMGANLLAQNDVDLHVARLQGATCNATGHGWFGTCRGITPDTNSPKDDLGDDCYYQPKTGCTGFNSNPSSWGYAQSPTDACHGWGSNRDPLSGCDNPRLDRDNVQCDATVKDPSVAGFGGLGAFCAAENINIDNPKHGDRFAIATHAYGLSGEVKPHVNVYCNGERRLALGHDPTSGQDFPKLKTTSSGDAQGDLWEAAVVEAIVDGSGVMTDCVVTPIHSATPKSGKDGSTDYCVDTNPRNSGTVGMEEWLFVSGGGYPANPDDLCWH